MNLLLIEDDEKYVETIRFMFELFAPGDVVVAVSTLKDAFIQLESPIAYRCILLDLNLPDAQDLQALVELSRKVPEIPIIVLTAWPQWRQDALQIGAKAYRMKNTIGGEELVELVHEICEVDCES